MHIPLGFDAGAGRLMEEGTKRRLIGAAVIVVLLVIFLPMLVEDELPPSVSEREMSIPPQLDFDQGYDASVLENPVEPSVSTFVEYEEPTQEDLPLPQELPPPALFEAPATTELRDTPEPVPVLVGEKPPAAKPRPPPKPRPAPKATSTSEPAPVPPSALARPPASPSAWVIQVASLRERDHAYEIVQKLRAKGFPAYLEEAYVKQELWHRVRIGPELERKRIESTAASLQRKTGRKGQIQRYP